MFFKNKNFFGYLIVLIVVSTSIFVYVVSESVTKQRIDTVKKEKYNIYSQDIYTDIDSLIRNKQELTFSIALALSKDSKIIQAIKEQNVKDINLKAFSNTLKNNTNLANVWFQIIDAKGVSFYRSWVPKRGDSLLNARMDVAKMIKTPQAMRTISTGKFDLTFKSMVPIYDNKTFVGMFEIITHFNSIAELLKQKGIESVIVVDKKYKKQLTKAFTKIFVGDYYIANYNAQKGLMNYLEAQGMENYIHSDEIYIIDEQNDYFIVIYNVPDIKGNPMASLITFKPLSSLNMDDIHAIKDNMFKYIIIVILLLLLIGYYFISKKHSNELDGKVQQRTKELEKEKIYIQTILDTNPNIIIVTDSFKIINANKRFLEFFKYESLEGFTKDYDCICDFFVTLDDELFGEDKLVHGTPWAEYIAKNAKEHIVQLKFENHLYIFTVSAEYLKNNGDILLTFQNITEIKRKDRLLYEQSKLASMGEMIGNIAHQWRQPLSIISSSSTGMKLQKEINGLSDEQFNKNCDLINENAQYLSKTIDDFRNFIKGDREQTRFLVKDELNKLLNLINPSIKANNIEFNVDIEDNLEMVGFSNELIQCFINIYNNSKDVLRNMPEDSRVIDAKAFKNKDEIIIIFKDSGGGIPQEVIDKIFEPYFTTKHQKQGTGLGLHMTYNMIVHGMNGNIEAHNEKFSLNDKEYYGAVFKITLPA